MSSSTSSTDRVVAGRVGRPHGLDGSFHVTRPRAALLDEGVVLHVAGATATVVRRSGTDERPILRLSTTASREDVEALRGADLEVSRGALPALGTDEWWAEDLEGLRVVDGDVEVGTVVRLMALPSCEALEVARPDGAGELLVPLVSDAVRSVDLATGTVDVSLEFLGETA